MSGTTTSVGDIAKSLRVDEKDLSNELITTGALPIEILSHTQAKEYVIKGITPDDFFTKHSTADVDISQLQSAFKAICIDYMEPLKIDVPSKAVEFCSKIIFEIGPDSRKVKKADGDKVWKFKFAYRDEDGKPYVACAFICTFKADNSEYKQTGEARKMILSVKQASLLALDTFCRLSDLAYTHDQTQLLLTPLAGAIFSKRDLPNLAAELKIGIPMLLRRINTSAQTGGHALEDSKIHLAAVCSLVATRGIKDEKVKLSIVTKVIKQYTARGKEFREHTFNIYARFAHGGVPANLSYSKLVESFDTAQNIKITTRKMAEAVAQSTKTSIVQAPRTPK